MNKLLNLTDGEKNVLVRVSEYTGCFQVDLIKRVLDAMVTMDVEDGASIIIANHKDCTIIPVTAHEKLKPINLTSKKIKAFEIKISGDADVNHGRITTTWTETKAN